MRGSWGRHNWPRSNETARLYRERDGAYLMIDTDPASANPGHYDAIANVYPGPEPSLVGTEIRHNYTYLAKCKRVAWDELPAEWQEAFTRYCSPRYPEDGIPPFEPEKIRGFWPMGKGPNVKTTGGRKRARTA